MRSTYIWGGHFPGAGSTPDARRQVLAGYLAVDVQLPVVTQFIV